MLNRETRFKICEFINFIISIIKGFPTAIGKMFQKHLQKCSRIFKGIQLCDLDELSIVMALRLTLCS